MKPESSGTDIRRLMVRFPSAVFLGAMAFAAQAGSDAIVLYPGYGDAHGAVIEGRVIESESTRPASATDSRWRNFVRNLGLLFNDEREGRKVTVQVAGKDWTAVTDEEGYLKVAIDGAPPLAPGWQPATARVGKQSAEGRLLVVPPENMLGIISDIDDTILISEVTDKDKLLANTLLKNPLQREAVPGVADFYRRLAARNPQPEAAPIIYLSASPRQLHGSIQAFLDFNRFPRGVLITKRITNDRTSEPLLDQVAYKTQKIEDILTRLPHARFVLVGDDGEKDPEIYHDIGTRHPARVEAIWIRRVHPDPARPKFPEQGDLAKALGTTENAAGKR
jgi:phosphatidate phosphatase APP1